MRQIAEIVYNVIEEQPFGPEPSQSDLDEAVDRAKDNGSDYEQFLREIEVGSMYFPSGVYLFDIIIPYLHA